MSEPSEQTPCPKCGQVDNGQKGTDPCPECKLPTKWDGKDGIGPNLRKVETDPDPEPAKAEPVDRLPGLDDLETAEFSSARDESVAVRNPADRQRNIRQLLLRHRFAVVTFVQRQGVTIPPALFMDESHPAVGDQRPDL